MGLFDDHLSFTSPSGASALPPRGSHLLVSDTLTASANVVLFHLIMSAVQAGVPVSPPSLLALLATSIMLLVNSSFISAFVCRLPLSTATRCSFHRHFSSIPLDTHLHSCPTSALTSDRLGRLPLRNTQLLRHRAPTPRHAPPQTSTVQLHLPLPPPALSPPLLLHLLSLSTLRHARPLHAHPIPRPNPHLHPTRPLPTPSPWRRASLSLRSPPIFRPPRRDLSAFPCPPRRPLGACGPWFRAG